MLDINSWLTGRIFADPDNPYKLMHCATWFLFCLLPLFTEERRNYLYLSAILWDIKQARSLSNLAE